MHILDMPIEESLETLNLIIDNLALVADDRLRKELEDNDFVNKLLKEAEKDGRDAGYADGKWDYSDH